MLENSAVVEGQDPLFSAWRDYVQALEELANVVAEPAKDHLPDVFKDPGLAITYSDPRGRQLLRLTSRKQCPSIRIGGEEVTCRDDRAFTLVPVFGDSSIERFLFPNVKDDDSVSMPINERFSVLKGIGFATADFAKEYWGDAGFPRIVGGKIPFSVDSDGCVLGLGLGHGYEADGNPIGQVLEYVRIFGASRLMFRDPKHAKDGAFRDFLIANGAARVSTAWSFSDFLTRLEGPVQQNVLLLGSFEDQSRLEAIRSSLRTMGYHGFTLLDAQDLPIQSNLEKLYAGVLASKFVIVVDDSPSGHLQELQELLEKRFRPVIVVRAENRRATWFSEDRLRQDDNFRVLVTAEVNLEALIPSLSWAVERTQEIVRGLDQINYWRSGATGDV